MMLNKKVITIRVIQHLKVENKVEWILIWVVKLVCQHYTAEATNVDQLYNICLIN